MLGPSNEDGIWINMRCKDHPNLRWTQKDAEHLAGCISRNTQLMFDGDITHPEREVFFVTGLTQLIDGFKSQDGLISMLQKFAFECPCPASLLVKVAADDYWTIVEDNAFQKKA